MEVFTGIAVNTSVLVGLSVGCRVGVFLVGSAVDVSTAVPVAGKFVGGLVRAAVALGEVRVGIADVLVGKGVLAGRVWVKSWVGAPNWVAVGVGDGVTVNTGVRKLTCTVSFRAGTLVGSRSLIVCQMMSSLTGGMSVGNGVPAL